MLVMMMALTSSTFLSAAGTCSFALSCCRHELSSCPGVDVRFSDYVDDVPFTLQRADACILRCDLRSCLNSALMLQATFFIAATIAARLGTAALAAHAVVSQLWVLASYIVDGFAVAGTVLGSRLVALRQQAGGSAVQVRHRPYCMEFCWHQANEPCTMRYVSCRAYRH